MRDRRLLWSRIVTVCAAVVLFSSGELLGIAPTTVALAVALLLLFIGRAARDLSIVTD
jgi:Na+/H+ antiporter NhaD/arsenite permease-like protein